MLAAHNGNLRIVKQLVETYFMPVDYCSDDAPFWSAIDYAEQQGHLHVVEYLKSFASPPKKVCLSLFVWSRNLPGFITLNTRYFTCF